MTGKWLYLLLLVLLPISLISAGCRPRQSGQPGPVFYSFPNQEAANSYIIADGGEAAVIDPSVPDEIVAALREKKLKPKYILLTHGHYDHITGIERISAEFPGIKVYLNPADSSKLNDAAQNLSTMFGARIIVNVRSQPLTEGMSLKVGATLFHVIFTPGHTPGSISIKTGNLLYSGDTLFKGAVGRTDFPGCSPQDLEVSLRKLVNLPDNTVVFPGHGQPTTIGAEKLIIDN